MIDYVKHLPKNVKLMAKDKIIHKFCFTDIIKIISEKLDFEQRTIVKYFRKSEFPIYFLECLENNTSFKIKDLLTEKSLKFRSKWKKVKLPNQMSSNLAYFIGYLQGDGCLESNKKRIDFVDEYLDQMVLINHICFNLFNLTGVIRGINSKISKKECYSLIIGSVILSSYINSVFNINYGIKKDLRIPKTIIKSDFLLDYIAGLYDADGTLPKTPSKCKQFFIDITLKDLGIILELKRFLKKYGIETLKPYCRVAKSPTSDFISKTWELRIRKKKDLVNFLNRVKFKHPDKARRQKELIKLLRP